MKFRDLADCIYFKEVLTLADEDYTEYGLDYDELMRPDGIRNDVFRDGEQVYAVKLELGKVIIIHVDDTTVELDADDDLDLYLRECTFTKIELY